MQPLKAIIISYINSLDKYNYSTILLNVIIFYTLQYMFFKYILSNMYMNIVLDKVNIIKNIMNDNTIFDLYIKNKINEDYDKQKENSEKESDVRNKLNDKLTLKYVFIPLILLSILFLFTIVYKWGKGRKWDIYDSISIVLILLAFLTEVYFLFLIVKKYIHVGDHLLIYNYLEKKI